MKKTCLGKNAFKALGTRRILANLDSLSVRVSFSRALEISSLGGLQEFGLLVGLGGYGLAQVGRVEVVLDELVRY